ncbi:MAG: hypothetical protein WBB69_06575 [Anaerolineales bacterium]
MNAKKKTRYETPRARDLSALGVSGGQCISGTALTSEVCRDGLTPVGGNCAPTGGQPEQGYCDFGGLATEGCWPTGAIHF